MSDPVTNVEIEDVLSSIRKLVSDDPRPSEKGSSDAKAPPERLVLTPDFRVQETEDESAETESSEAVSSDEYTVSEDDLTDFDVDPVSDDDAASLFEAADGASEIEEISDLSAEDTVDEDVSDAPMFEDVPEDALQAEIVEISATAPSDPLESRIAELEAAVAQQEESWDPDGLDDSDENTPSALSSSVSDIWETVEPEEIPVSTPAQEPVLEAEEEAEDDAAEASEDAFDAFATEDDARLDEEALREMVSELVRQELQGALGARITRNVRKLVRREIHRIMDSKDFD
ncbi:DUF2497 domain-containing protein [Cognatishimia sp. MH4019]|uniref:DUF2497 domain-containing protein n=1 Tax=Cognatishimia sp. MH4019 TaxID=2854030 RepID=UPI001CD284CE|nr:DUF2497 domain-containing protein [Cognatishimia sp. MH4019]